MRFSLSFSMDGAAFDGADNSVDEVVRILHTLADRVDHNGAHGRSVDTVRDVNGNTIGKWVIDDE
jgi:hypothetical protein